MTRRGIIQTLIKHRCRDVLHLTASDVLLLVCCRLIRVLSVFVLSEDLIFTKELVLAKWPRYCDQHVRSKKYIRWNLFGE